MTRALALAFLLAAACGIPSNGPTMQPGRNCLDCHSAGGEEDARSFTAAGTVFASPGAATSDGVQGARVSLTDANGKTVTLRTNQAGNFYTREGLAFPLVARVESGGVTRLMTLPVPSGDCNRCHDLPPRGDGTAGTTPTGRIALVGGGSGDEFMNPGDDCLACHDGRGALRFTAAGTAYPSSGSAANQGLAGVTVRLRGPGGAVVKELVSNRVGNFFTTDPLPAAVTIEIGQGATLRLMEDPVAPPISCNRCHLPGGAAGRVATGG